MNGITGSGRAKKKGMYISPILESNSIQTLPKEEVHDEKKSKDRNVGRKKKEKEDFTKKTKSLREF